MRSLALSLYVLVLGCMLLISYVVELWGMAYYKQDVSEQYLQYSNMLTPLIEKELIAQPNQIDKTLAHWSTIIEEDIEAIQYINLPDSSARQTAYIDTLDITDQTDFIHIISPLKQKTHQGKALSFTFYDSFSDSLVVQYYMGRIVVYIFMTLILTLIAWLVYRYINQLSRVAKSVAAGNFALKMPDNRLQALQNLATDINAMAMSIEEKHNENLILTGAIHHELRIPITRIRLALDMLMQMKSDSTSLELLVDMDDDLEELSCLMEELLTISRLRLKGIELDKEEIAICSILNTLIDKTHRTEINDEMTTDFKINANCTLLERALINIINNALKYCNNRVVISTKNESDFFILTIEDDGMGIPENERALILKPFYRTDKSRNRNTGGFGLGLAIADLVIKDCQGQLKITESKLGGAAISIYWKR